MGNSTIDLRQAEKKSGVRFWDTPGMKYGPQKSQGEKIVLILAFFAGDKTPEKQRSVIPILPIKVISKNSLVWYANREAMALGQHSFSTHFRDGIKPDT